MASPTWAWERRKITDGLGRREGKLFKKGVNGIDCGKEKGMEWNGIHKEKTAKTENKKLAFE
jgi:hypothetical protein